MAAAAVLTSASGVLSLLSEPDDSLKVHALHQLDRMVDHYWLEIAAVISEIEALYEQESFKERNLAALVASKVYYHLEEYDDALRFALGAGDLFDVMQKNQFVETLTARCIDTYIERRVAQEESKDAGEGIDPALEAIVERMFDRCFADYEFKQALGIALEARRMDMVKRSIEISGDVPGMLSYCFELCQKVISNRNFRQTVLRVLVDLYATQAEPDFVNMCQCLHFLDDHQRVASTLDSLVKGDDRQVLLAYQVAFDLTENQNQPFLLRVSKALPADEAPPAATPPGATKPSSINSPLLDDDSYQGRLRKLRLILSGELPTDLYLHFLYGQNKADLNILRIMKDKLEGRNSVTHNALVMAHAIMHAGTTVDVFLRDNLEWLSRATNWAKFTATASIGVIHRGHHTQSLKLLEQYLPQHGQSGSPYQEGGALYALGLIHANGTGDKLEYLRDALRNAGNNEIVQHGACLGIGLCGMASASGQGEAAISPGSLYDTLKNVMFTDSAVAGEAAGIAMGLVLLGSGDGAAIEEMLAYAHDTKHEKIIRGIALGLALISYGREEAADVLIEQLLRDKDPILRYGCMYTIAMAYVGTSNNRAIRRLLHVAVSDVSNDVRRAAVNALGFVLCNSVEQVPRTVELLADSYNAHVRYGACLAVGTACAGTGLKEAIDLLEPMTKDRVDFVRQAAYISLAMVVMQLNSTREPRVEAIRKSFNDAIAAKGDTMTKFGAVLGAGIIDAGGRNVTISLLSPQGHKKMAAIVGMALFPQFWYWYPLVHFISLSLTPTAVIGLNRNLKIPEDFTFVSNAPPSAFAYPPVVELKKEEKKKKVPTAQLSVSLKSRARAKKKAGDNSDPSEGPSLSRADSTASSISGMDVDPEKDKKDASKETPKEGETPAAPAAPEEKKDEPKTQTLKNPARVTRQQQSLVTFPADQRYLPVKKTLAGIVLLQDTRPDQPETLLVQSAPKVAIPGVSEDEPAPPQPFEFRG